MEYEVKFVNFEWCKSCKHKDKAEDEEPCRDCLDEPTNLHSEKPVKWEEK